MKWHSLLLLLLLFVIPAVHAMDIDKFSNEVEAFVNGDDTIIVMGKYASKTEKTTLTLMQKSDVYIKDIQVVDEKNFSGFNGIVILIGGPGQNEITASALDSFIVSKTMEIPIGLMTFIDDPKYIIISDNAGYDNTARRGLEKSPLARFIPLKYVPLAAAATGFGLMWFVKIILGLLHKIFRFATSYKIMNFVKKKQPNKKYKGIKIFGVRFKLREWIAVTFSAIVFALAFSWSFLAPSSFLSELLILNFIVNFVVYAVWMIARLIIETINDLHTEYVFWFWGGIITIISGWLGNAFCLAGYNISHKETSHDIKVAYLINLFAFAISTALIILNIFFPSRILQLAGLYSLAFIFLDMLPMKPFSGKSILKWNKVAYFLTFIPMALLYVITNLLP